ncbi:S8 family serine peptidase [Dyella tabacisoli]|uniref:Autotransporter domain-containing protein n=1 Tax=Dyella tabacisoli TaxID=2282381 RepID=A0A369UVI5_9GAMM|nr:S8 family serine peptidase [Dyella tabacisoli]RDD83610.1 autotransporter domain-containing protein [Dyella tabacisoli]
MNTKMRGLRRREAVALILMALSLSACGGGGGGNGNVKVTPTTPPPPPVTPSTQPPFDAQLGLTNTYAAHSQGFTGRGVTIGVVDSGIMRNHPALAGRVVKELVYVDPSANNLGIDDVVGHGTWVSEIAAGTAFAQYPGGIAPGANLVAARIISDTAPKDDGSGQGNRVSTADPLGAVNNDLIANGVKVSNNSWGGLYWDATDTATTQSFHDAYNKFINQWGGLVVFAAGNDSKADPSDVAALPNRAPDLTRGWLVVVAVDSNNPTHLASYSNACGKAMSYCLAAAGDVIVSGKDDTVGNPTYWIVKGTSLAAPQVTGAAALVWQAYPYFSNDLVRQTLLGTATDLGAPGPDPVFGYGMLNVGKAVNGPAKFDWGDVTVNFTGASSWNNAISGAGGLIKQGSGTLTLTQPASYAGLTQVQAGVLVARSLASSVNISAGGQLADTPSISGSISNAGVLTVRGGDVTVGGDYNQQGAGRLALELGSALRVTGHASLTGGDLFVIGAKQGYVVNSHTDVLSASAGLSGTFSALNSASNVLLNATLNYGATSAWLNVQQVQVSAVQGVSYTPASYAAAQRVDNAFGQINTQLGQSAVSVGAKPSDIQQISPAFIAGAASLQQSPTTAAVQHSLESLSGQLHAASAAMTFEAIDAGTRALSDRFDHLLDAPVSGGWAQDLGYHGSMSRNGYGNVGYDLSGWMIGQDRRFGSNGISGFAISQAQGLGRLAESADQGRSHAMEGMLYGGLIQNDWYAIGRIGIGSYRETMRRSLQLGTQLAGVASDSRGSYDVAYGESGYRYVWGGTQLTPYVNLQYARIQRDGFNEFGGSGFGLKSNAQITERWQAGIGLRAMHRWTLAGGGHLSLQMRLLWQQAFAMRGEVFQASFNGVEQWAPLAGIGLSRYSGVAGTTLNWEITPRSSLLLGYDQHFSQRGQANMATLNYQYGF